MRLGSHVTQTEQRIGAQLPLNRREVVLGIRIAVARGCRGHARLRKKRRKINIRDGICRTSAIGRDVQRKGIDVNGTIPRGDEGCRKQWRRWAGVAQSVGRLGLVNRGGIPLDHGIKDSVAGPNARLPGPAENFAPDPVRYTRRVCQTEPWRKALALRHERVRYSRITHVDQPRWGGGVALGLLSWYEGRILV